MKDQTHLSPGSHLPGCTLLLLAHLHRLGFRRATKAVIETVLAKLTPSLAVLVAFSARHKALKDIFFTLYSYRLL